MGLDMYLDREVYFGELEFRKYSKDAKNIEIRVPGVDSNKVVSVTERVCYWRKSNMIHNWFVQNVQGGNDDCGRYYVSWEKLEELYNTVIKVLKSKDGKVADKLLPTQSGCFFGDTEFGEWYWEDLKRTVETLRPYVKVKVPPRRDFYYSSSW